MDEKIAYLLGLILSVGKIDHSDIDICVCGYDKVFCKKIFKIYNMNTYKNCGFCMPVQQTFINIFSMQLPSFKKKYEIASSDFTFPDIENTNSLWSFIRAFVEGNLMIGKREYHDTDMYITGNLQFLSQIGYTSDLPFHTSTDPQKSHQQISYEMERMVNEYFRQFHKNPDPYKLVEISKEAIKTQSRLSFGKHTLRFLIKMYTDCGELYHEKARIKYLHLCQKNIEN